MSLSKPGKSWVKKKLTDLNRLLSSVEVSNTLYVAWQAEEVFRFSPFSSEDLS